MRNLILFILLFFNLSVFAQDGPQMLLLDPNVELECTEAVNDIYNFKFDRADKEFQILKLKYPEHPLPYFLKGLSLWWQMMPYLKFESQEDAFIAYMDSSITKAEKLYDEDKTKVEGAFFLSAAHGFKAEFYGDNNSYTKATFSGRNALKYLMDYKDNNSLSPEFLFGVGLYNYYEIWIKEEYPLLKPILFFFPNGDKPLGIKQMNEVAENGFYTRTEAQYRLTKILLDDEDNMQGKALPYAKYLNETFPDNPVFHRLYAKALFYNYDYHNLEPTCLQILQKIDNHEVGYEEISGRYAGYFLGKIYRSRHQNDLAKKYFSLAVEFADKIKAYTGYYLYSLQNLAEIAKEEGDSKKAKEYYELIRKNGPTDEEDYKKARKDAKHNIKELKKQKAGK